MYNHVRMYHIQRFGQTEQAIHFKPKGPSLSPPIVSISIACFLNRNSK